MQEEKRRREGLYVQERKIAYNGNDTARGAGLLCVGWAARRHRGSLDFWLHPACSGTKGGKQTLKE
jgi:hypothetical protein